MTTDLAQYPTRRAFRLAEMESAADGGEGALADRPATRRRPPRPPQTKRDTKDHGRRIRRAAGIHAYVGHNGSGKSAAMVFDTLPTLAGQRWRCSEISHRHMRDDYVDPITGAIGPTETGLRMVWSTVELLDAETGEPHPLYRRMSEENGGWQIVLDAEHCDLLFDEVTGIAGSREYAGMPVAVQNILQQLRRRDVRLRWTAPKWERADAIIRGCTQLVTLCRGYFPDNRGVRNSDEPPAWVPNRLFKWRTFDARQFDDFSASKAAGDRKGAAKQYALRAKPVAWVWGPGSLMFASYDTYGEVTRIAEYLDGGRCAKCGMKIPVGSCKGHDEPHKHVPASLPVSTPARV